MSYQVGETTSTCSAAPSSSGKDNKWRRQELSLEQYLNLMQRHIHGNFTRDDWQPEAIRHYLELRLSEIVKADRERKLIRMMEEDDDTL